MLVVFGSIHMDHHLRVKKFPKVGESVFSSSYSLFPGGKGANQAFASARIGAKTALVGKVGDDGMGMRVIKHLKRNEVMTSGIATSEELLTGMASVIKNTKGDDQIIIASGANEEIHASQAPADIFNENSVLLVQMELSMEHTEQVIKNAKSKGSKIILNMSPVAEFSMSLLKLVDYLIINSIEADKLAKSLGLPTEDKAKKLASLLAKQGDLTCVVTRGEKGSVMAVPKGTTYEVPAGKFGKIIDKSAAGDCFCGTFAACIYKKRLASEALRYAAVAASLSCTVEGAQESFPFLADIEEKLENFPKAV